MMKLKQKNKCVRCEILTDGYICKDCFEKLALYMVDLIKEKDKESKKFWDAISGKYN